MVSPGGPRSSSTQDANSDFAEPDSPPPPAWDLLSVGLLIFFVGLLILVAALVGLPLILG